MEKTKKQTFQVNEHKKKQNHFKNLCATTGGKIAAAFIVILIIATIALPIYLHFNGYQLLVELDFNDPASDAAFLPWATAVFFICMLIIAVGIFSRQRGRNGMMRINEQLELDGRTLIYTYSMRVNRWYPANGKTLVAIDLDHTTVTYDKRQNLIVFNGKIETQLLTTEDSAKSVAQMLLFPIDPPIRPNADGTAPNFVPDGTNKKGYFEIYDYFEPTLTKTLGL